MINSKTTRWSHAWTLSAWPPARGRALFALATTELSPHGELAGMCVCVGVAVVLLLMFFLVTRCAACDTLSPVEALRRNFEEQMSLPLSPQMDDQEVDYIIGAIKSAAEKLRA